MSRLPGPRTADLVPLADRLRYMQALRVVLGLVIVAYAAAVPESIGVPLSQVAGVTAVFVLGSFLGYGVWLWWRGRGITLFGSMIIADGFYLAWVAYVNGGAVGSLRYLILVHLIAVALLASYRTGLKLALWHSILAFATYHLIEEGFIDPISLGAALPGTGYERLAAFIAVFWLVVLGTSSFAAINERELRRRRVDLEALAALATRLESATDQVSVAETLAEGLARAFDFERVVILGAEDDVVIPLAGHGVGYITGAEGRSDAIVRRAWEERRTQLVAAPDPGEDPLVRELLPGAERLIVLPLFAEARAVGAVVAEHGLRRGSRVERRVVSMSERFCSHGALALSGARLLEEVQRLASVDGLTKVANRRTFEATLEREVERSARTGEELSLAMFDIDHFKRFNDEHGHQMGDEVLRVVGATLKDNVRAFDTVARYGGEEFAVILPRCDAEEALRLADRLRLELCDAPVPVPVTASGGVATLPVHAQDGEALIRAADKALYRSKQAGRNRVGVARARGGASGPRRRRRRATGAA